MMEHGFIKDLAQGKLTDCVDDFPSMFDHLEERVSV